MSIDPQIAVAKAMGWRLHTQPDGERVLVDPKHGVAANDLKEGEWPVDALPPLTLNLMWEAEEMLSEPEHDRFTEALINELGAQCLSLREMVWAVAHAGIEPRAKSWLKVKGVEL